MLRTSSITLIKKLSSFNHSCMLRKFHHTCLNGLFQSQSPSSSSTTCTSYISFSWRNVHFSMCCTTRSRSCGAVSLSTFQFLYNDDDMLIFQIPKNDFIVLLLNYRMTLISYSLVWKSFSNSKVTVDG